MRRPVVMVLNWNGWPDTMKCLDSLRRSRGAHDDIWVIDNCSVSDHRSDVFTRIPNARVLRWDDNYGFAGGYNRALRLAAKEGITFAYLLNNDATVTDYFLDPLLDAAADNELGCIGSRIVYSGPEAFVEFDGDQYYGRGVLRFNPQVGVRRVRAAVGAGMLVRVEAMERCGYFDERFFCYWEDIEWCLRIARSGFGSAIAGESVIIHAGGRSSRKSEALYYRIRNRFLMLEYVAPNKRQREICKIVYDAAVTAEDARRRKSWEEWSSLACGLDDGFNGRFGRRGAMRPTAMAIVRLAKECAWAIVRDKSAVVRGRPVGWPYAESGE